ncbi:uncharacterized protein B0I36DRAFT_312924 [Microdochium trichocladiopsis]|uniref:Uncharacterized protein n=1 Tax=Microdochium trichocladiopsis TaxID=1682393 RepID=A0A9P8YJD9_9PEZI|nr:uncharacterized protein B0I36DRAFT_312924 [Microdochium trichocladiopsis]KAH7041494.1 hypothetical protein B0I36DRAFT_312924 [Microdochium trichocladiopsis]
MHRVTFLLAVLCLGMNVEAAPQFGNIGMELSSQFEDHTNTTSPVVTKTLVTSSRSISATLRATAHLTDASIQGEEQETAQSSMLQMVPPSAPAVAQSPDTVRAMNALAQATPPPGAAVAPATAAGPAAAAAAVTTPPPQVPSFDEAYGDEYMQTTYWSCNTFALTTHCGWHEPIIYIGGGKSGAASSISGSGRLLTAAVGGAAAVIIFFMA